MTTRDLSGNLPWKAQAMLGLRDLIRYYGYPFGVWMVAFTIVQVSRRNPQVDGRLDAQGEMDTVALLFSTLMKVQTGPRGNFLDFRYSVSSVS